MLSDQGSDINLDILYNFPENQKGIRFDETPF
jgi:hypothetical protein